MFQACSRVEGWMSLVYYQRGLGVVSEESKRNL